MWGISFKRSRTTSCWGSFPSWHGSWRLTLFFLSVSAYQYATCDVFTSTDCTMQRIMNKLLHISSWSWVVWPRELAFCKRAFCLWCFLHLWLRRRSFGRMGTYIELESPENKNGNILLSRCCLVLKFWILVDQKCYRYTPFSIHCKNWRLPVHMLCSSFYVQFRSLKKISSWLKGSSSVRSAMRRWERKEQCGNCCCLFITATQLLPPSSWELFLFKVWDCKSLLKCGIDNGNHIIFSIFTLWFPFFLLH